MTTIEVSPTTYEPCDVFVGEPLDEAPTCASCGWLESEHAAESELDRA